MKVWGGEEIKVLRLPFMIMRIIIGIAIIILALLMTGFSAVLPSVFSFNFSTILNAVTSWFWGITLMNKAFVCAGTIGGLFLIYDGYIMGRYR